MNIKLMVCLMVAASSLHGSEGQITKFNEAIHSSMAGRKQGKCAPIIIYGNQSIADIKSAVDTNSENIVETFNAEDGNLSEKPLSTIIISGGAGNLRVILKKDLKSDDDVNCWIDCSKTCVKQDLDEYLENQRGLVVFDLYAISGCAMTGQYAKDIDDLSSKKNIALIVKVDPKYSGLDLIKLCQEKQINPTVLNKPTIFSERTPDKPTSTGLIVWCQKHWIVSGASLIALLSMIYRYRYMFIKG